jgi:hypothetical protein
MISLTVSFKLFITVTICFFVCCNILRGTLRSRHKIRVDFDKICMFCNKCCVRIDKCVFIVVKIKYVNSGRISDICDKINFITKLYTFYNT